LVAVGPWCLTVSLTLGQLSMQQAGGR